MSHLRRNWLLAVGVVAIVAGFGLLAGGSLSLGPLLLVGGYCVALPLFLWRNFRSGVGE